MTIFLRFPAMTTSKIIMLYSVGPISPRHFRKINQSQKFKFDSLEVGADQLCWNTLKMI